MRRIILFLWALSASLTSFGQITSENRQLYQYYFLEAICQQQKNNYAAAFDLLRYAQKLNPEAPEVYFQLSGYYIDLKQDSLARVCFAKAAELNPQNDTYLERLGQYFISQREYEKGIDAYERLYEHHRDRTDVLQLLFRLYGTQNNFPKMIEMLNRVETVEGSSEQLTLTKMQVYEQQGEKDKVVGELRNLVAKHPNDLNYRVMLGNWLLQNDKPKAALEQYNYVLAEEPDHVAAQVSMLDYYQRQGMKEKADDLTRQLLNSKKVDSETRMTLLQQFISNAEKNGEDSTKVLRLFDHLLALPQENADMIVLKASYQEMKKMPEDSIIATYMQALEVEPDNASARFRLVRHVWSQNDYDRVIALCRPAQQYNPEEMVFYFFQGFAQYQKDEQDEALETFRKGVSQINSDSNPDIVGDSYSIMGDILLHKGLNKEAYAAYDSCLQWKPDHLPTLNNYAYYLSIAGLDLEKAEKMSYKTIKAEPTNSTYLDTYAWILFLQHRYDEAKAYIDRAMASESDLSGVILEHAGDIYAQNGDIDEAVGLWQKAFEKGETSEVLKKKIKLRKYVEK